MCIVLQHNFLPAIYEIFDYFLILVTTLCFHYELFQAFQPFSLLIYSFTKRDGDLLPIFLFNFSFGVILPHTEIVF